MTFLRGFCVSALCAVVGCSADGANGTGDGTGGATGTGGGTSTGGAGGGFNPGGSGGATFGGGPNAGGSAGGGNPDECESVTQMAEKQTGGRADIIIIVDNSGSMGSENLAVQNNLNSFSTFITSRGIDVHVVLISGAPGAGGWFGFGGGNGICIEPPLGMPGACPNGDDTNIAAGYMHWHEEVGSTNALKIIQNTFASGGPGNMGWQGMLRADATKTFVVITDDEASPADPDGFRNWVNAQPVFAASTWKFSGIFCLTDSNNCADRGETYETLVQVTGGIVGDLGAFSDGSVDAEFQAVFNTLGEAVVADARPVDCEWSIPPVPSGQTFDPRKVNVDYTPSTTGTPQRIYKVANESACTEEYGGWFYDNEMSPSRVKACPSSCAVMQADDGARVDVVFGCVSEEPPIE